MVDDNEAVRVSVATVLRIEGYDVREASDGEAALRSIATSPPDAIVLDVMMPGIDGLTLCRRLRAAGNRTPILVLTVRTEVTDRIAGLDAGADDYLAKPFDLSELTARMRALLRRSQPDAPATLQFGDLRVDTATRSGTRGGRYIEFSQTEFALLELFLINPGRVLTRDIIAERVWDTNFGPVSNSIAVYISYLRSKLEAEGEARIIKTVRGIGYRLSAS